MRARRLILVAIASSLLLAAAVLATGGPPEVAAPAKTGGGSLEVVEGISVLTLSGTARDMGHEHGRLLGHRLVETEAAFKKIMPPIPGGAVGRWLVRRFVMLQLGRIEKHLTADELDEFKGIADNNPGYRGGYREILYYHVLQDIGQNYACTGVAAEGGTSMLQGPVAGRNFDLDSRGMLEPLKTVFFYRPDSGHSFAHVAWPGMVGAVSGMNDSGLCVMEFSARSGGTALTGVPVAFIVKRLLKDASDVEQAVEIIRNARRMGPNIFLLADRTKAVAVEFDSGKVSVRDAAGGILPVANHFLAQGLAEDRKNVRQAKYSDSRQRFDRVKYLAEGAGRLGVGETLAILRDHSGPDGRAMAWGDASAINNYKGAHSVIFDPANLRFWVSTAPQAYGRFVGFGFTETGLKRVFSLPEDVYPRSEKGRRAAGSDALMLEAEEAEAQGRRKDAVVLAEKALAADEGNYLAALYMGDARQDDGDYEGAYRAYDGAVRFAPAGSGSLASALAGRGEASRRLGRPDEARADFNAVLEMGCDEGADKAARTGLRKL